MPFLGVFLDVLFSACFSAFRWATSCLDIGKFEQKPFCKRDTLTKNIFGPWYFAFQKVQLYCVDTHWLFTCFGSQLGGLVFLKGLHWSRLMWCRKAQHHLKPFLGIVLFGRSTLMWGWSRSTSFSSVFYGSRWFGCFSLRACFFCTFRINWIPGRSKTGFPPAKTWTMSDARGGHHEITIKRKENRKQTLEYYSLSSCVVLRLFPLFWLILLSCLLLFETGNSFCCFDYSTLLLWAICCAFCSSCASRCVCVLLVRHNLPLWSCCCAASTLRFRK